MREKIIMKKITFSFPLACLLLLNGCATNNAFMDNIGKTGGTVAGAGIGAIIGKQLGGDTGLIVGALIGGSVGYLIGDEIDKRRAELARIAKEEKVEVFSENITSKNLGITDNTNASSKKDDVIGDSFTIISDDNQFNVGSSSLNSKATQVFTKFAEQYKGTDKKILVIGHTDDSGDSSFNQKLSEERAKNVGQIFNNQGIKQSNIYYLGAGEMNPIADNNVPSGANKNRRVEIVELNDVKDIAIYSSRTSTPEYFKKVTPKAKVTKNVEIAKTIEVKKIKESSVVKNDVIKKEEKPKELISEKAKNVIPDKQLVVDFNGLKVANNTFALKEEFGSSVQEKSFSLINKAYANNDTNVYVSCMYDKPRSVGKTKSLETNKDIDYSTNEFKKGLNEVPWIAQIDKNLVGINPVGVLSNGSKITKNPKVTVYKDYSANSNQKADLSIETSVNTYQGSDGLIYRIFLEDQNKQLECMDIVFNEKNILDSKGVIYYSKNDGVYERTFNVTQITKK